MPDFVAVPTSSRASQQFLLPEVPGRIVPKRYLEVLGFSLGCDVAGLTDKGERLEVLRLTVSQ